MASDLEDRIETLARWIFEAEYPVVLTGAGLATDSGVPDYRGPDGVWTRRDKGLSTKWPDLSVAQPNSGHLAIFELQELGKLSFLISQNIDNLHLKSGINPDRLAEVHGNTALLRCENCDTKIEKSAGQETCECGGKLVSSVVNFGQSLPQKEIMDSYRHSENSDLFIVVGSSLVVTPAADMPGIAAQAGARLVIINDGDTPLDRAADLRFSERIADVLPPAVDRLKDLLQ